MRMKIRCFSAAPFQPNTDPKRKSVSCSEVIKELKKDVDKSLPCNKSLLSHYRSSYILRENQDKKMALEKKFRKSLTIKKVKAQSCLKALR